MPKGTKRHKGMVPVDDIIEANSSPKRMRIRTTKFTLNERGNTSAKFKTVTISTDLPSGPESSNPSALVVAEETSTFPSIFDKHIPSTLGSDPPVFPFEAETTIDFGALGSNSRARRTTRIQDFLQEREAFLAEELRREGRGDYMSGLCNRCCYPMDVDGAYRCMDCDGGEICCKTCMISVHKTTPLHRIERWNNTFFERMTLKDLGLRVQLGHPFGKQCRNPRPSSMDSFVIVDVNGVHKVGLDFCDCETAQPNFIQILRFHWIPASTDRPQTAVTTRVLQQFQKVSFGSKCSAFQFYNALARLTNDTAPNGTKDRYKSFMSAVRIYNHLKLLKRAGKGHELGGADSIKPGELALLCPACPQDGINMKEGWKSAPPGDQWLYASFLAIDANFRLKRKNVSSETADPSLNNGGAYFVPTKEYRDFIHQFGTSIEQRSSTCSNHHAVNASRMMQGLAASGVGTVDCARHDFKRPVSVGDLQKGERYVNMDYLFFYSIQGSELVVYVVSYDIACQWSLHLWERLKKYSTWTVFEDHEGKKFRFLVPKFHLAAHITACQTKYSFNFNVEVGRTDGEAPERNWSMADPAAASTREMGPGSRCDTLDSIFGDQNWLKTVNMGPALLEKIKEAVIERNQHEAFHAQFTAALPEDDVKDWMARLEAWEADHNAPNPFEREFHTITIDTVRRELAAQEAAELKSGIAVMMHEEISASQLINMGLGYEKQQRQLKQERNSLSQHATDNQKAKLLNRCNSLTLKIKAWIQVQLFYMPGLRVIRSKEEKEKADLDVSLMRAEGIHLWLPSAAIHQIPCDRRLQEIEWAFRRAQANEALDDLRNALRFRSFLYRDKKRFQFGQKQNTRSQSLISNVNDKVSAAADSYRGARTAMVALAGSLSYVNWESDFPVLLPSDIRSLQVDDGFHGGPSQTHPSEGRRTISWIWMRAGVISTSDESKALHDDLRIEWCKGKARADRWKEEVCLLLEEMSRVKRFLAFKVQLWKEKAKSATTDHCADPCLVEGLVAFAHGQAQQFKVMQSSCEQLWRHVDQYVALTDVIDVIPAEWKASDDGDE